MPRGKKLPIILAMMALVLPVGWHAVPVHVLAQHAGGTPVHTQAPDARDPFASLVARSQDRGAVAPGRRVSLILSLKDPTAARLTADVNAMYDPNAATFGHFKTPAQLDARYGPPASRVMRVLRILRGYGLSGQWRRGNNWLVVAGPARRVDAVFHVSVHAYVAPDGVRYEASARDPTLPRSLQPDVDGVSRISSYFRPLAHAIRGSGLTPVDLLDAYDITALRKRGLTGAGETVVFIELEGYAQKDLDGFTQHFHLPPMHPQLKAGPRLPPEIGEAEMDLEVVHEIAPAAQLRVYTLDSTSTDADWLALQDRMVRENPGAIFSESLGKCDRWVDPLHAHTQARIGAHIYEQAAAAGDAVFAATGDAAAFDCLEHGDLPRPPTVALGTDFPAAIPWVTAVGGTRLSVRQDNTWYGETVWEYPSATQGTGGGVSAYFKMPPWQRGPGVQNLCLNPHNMREIPDVSAVADPTSSPIVDVMGELGPGNGTSESAPVWAGMMALIDQYLKTQGLHRVGSLNPALYYLAMTRQRYPPFHDVTVGTNLYYPATPGYDMASGLGTPDAWNLARDLAAYVREGHR